MIRPGSGPLPSFIVIGAMKAGTTSLHHYLAAHPDLHLPGTKELNFFRDERHFSRGEGWYRAQFAGARPGQQAGEVSPDYTKHPRHKGAPARMRAVVPDVRLVYLVRHPVRRMRSMYLHQVAAGRERRPVDEALLEDPHYLDVSRYALQVERYLEHFPREQLLVASSEQLAVDRPGVLASVHRFVGVAARPDTAAAVEGEWYRGEQRRRRGGVARAAAAVPLVRRSFDRLPTGLRSGVLRLGSSAVPAGTADTSPATDAVLAERLRPDLLRFRAVAPEVVDGWALLDRPPGEDRGTGT